VGGCLIQLQHELLKGDAELCGDTDSPDAAAAPVVSATGLLLLHCAPPAVLGHLEDLLGQGNSTGNTKVLELVRQSFDVLIDKAGTGVLDFAGVVDDRELIVETDTRRDVMSVLWGSIRAPSKVVVQLGDEFGVLLRAASHATPGVVKGLQDADDPASPLQQLEAGSVVVEANVSPVDPLPGVLLLLHLEQVAIKMTLEAFVRVVDEELLKAIGVKVLKTVNVENSNEAEYGVVGKVRARGVGIIVQRFNLRRYSFIEAVHKPEEERFVNELGQGVAFVNGLGDGLGFING